MKKERTGMAGRLVAALLVLLLHTGLIAQAFAAGDTNLSAASLADTTPLSPIGPGDSISMQVYGKPELAVSAEVSEDGSFLVPLVGPIVIGGLSATQAASRIADAYAKGEFLVNPQVSITVKETRSQQIAVLGEVSKPGRLAVTSNTSLFDLLALVGGVTQEAGSTLFLIRKDAQGHTNRTQINLTQLLNDNPTLPDIRLLAGDTLFVPRAARFYISGEITQPGQFKLEPGMTLLQAIARAGGITRRGSSSRVDVKRIRPDGGVATISMKLSDPVLADDVIQVKESFF